MRGKHASALAPQGGTGMSTHRYRLALLWTVVGLTLWVSPRVFSQIRPHGGLIPSVKPLLKLTGFVNPTILPNEPRPVVTLALPGQEQRYKFLVVDTKVLPGPLITPGDIFDEVKRYTTSFYVRGPQEAMTQISSAAPTDQLIITAEYASSGRFLFIQSIELGEDPLQEKQEKKVYKQ
jgi:hypothetical protein